MQPISVICLFCEDIRVEKNEMNTLVGILPDNMNIERVPAAIPKLGIYVRINIDPSVDPGPISLQLSVPGADALPIGEIDANLIEKARKEAQARGSPIAGIISRAVFAPFHVTAAGRMRVLASIGGEAITCGSLNIQVVNPATSASVLNG